MKKLSTKQKMLKALTKKEGYNTFSVAQAVVRFGVKAKTVTARISELRKEGYAIYTNLRTRKDGSKVSIYRLGKPSKSLKAQWRAMGIRAQAV